MEMAAAAAAAKRESAAAAEAEAAADRFRETFSLLKGTAGAKRKFRVHFVKYRDGSNYTGELVRGELTITLQKTRLATFLFLSLEYKDAYFCQQFRKKSKLKQFDTVEFDNADKH